MPHLSVVVPAFNEEMRISSSLRRLGSFLASQPYLSEIVVVDDGSDEAGRTAAREALDVLPQVIMRQYLQFETNRGKGAAVKAGVLAARGEIVGFIDADLASPPEDLVVLLHAIEAGADVAIGVRNQEDGTDMRSQRGMLRRIAGDAYSLLMRRLLLPEIEDSQCPLKLFRREAARRAFMLQRVNTWAFDAELLFIASRMKLVIAKAPVRWEAVPGSHLRLNLSALKEVWNLAQIRWWHRGVRRETPSP